MAAGITRGVARQGGSAIKVATHKVLNLLIGISLLAVLAGAFIMARHWKPAPSPQVADNVILDNDYLMGYLSRGHPEDLAAAARIAKNHHRLFGTSPDGTRRAGQFYGGHLLMAYTYHLAGDRVEEKTEIVSPLVRTGLDYLLSHRDLMEKAMAYRQNENCRNNLIRLYQAAIEYRNRTDSAPATLGDLGIEIPSCPLALKPTYGISASGKVITVFCTAQAHRPYDAKGRILSVTGTGPDKFTVPYGWAGLFHGNGVMWLVSSPFGGEADDEIPKYITIPKAATVADVGCGAGYFAFRFAQDHPDARVYALDVDPYNLDVPAYFAARYHLGNLFTLLCRADDCGREQKSGKMVLQSGSVEVLFVKDVLHCLDQKSASAFYQGLSLILFT